MVQDSRATWYNAKRMLHVLQYAIRDTVLKILPRPEYEMTKKIRQFSTTYLSELCLAM